MPSVQIAGPLKTGLINLLLSFYLIFGSEYGSIDWIPDIARLRKLNFILSEVTIILYFYKSIWPSFTIKCAQFIQLTNIPSQTSPGLKINEWNERVSMEYEIMKLLWISSMNIRLLCLISYHSLLFFCLHFISIFIPKHHKNWW